MVKLTEKQQRDLLIAGGLADFVTRGKITAAGYDALKAVISAGGRAIFSGTRRAAPAVGRFTGRSALRAAGTIGKVAMRHPVLTAGAIIYVNRDEAAELLREGYDVVSTTDVDLPTEEIMERFRRPRQVPLDAGTPSKPKRKTAYNRAVSAGLKAVKKSKFGGKSGKLTSPKKTFATVAKTASRIRKGQKVSNKGATGTAARAMRKILKRSI